MSEVFEAPDAESGAAPESPKSVRAAEKRAAAELVRASQVFAREDRARTWRLLVGALAVAGVGEGIALFAPWWLALAGSVLAGLTLVRLFIFYHDHVHGALLVDSRLGNAILTAVGMATLSPPAVWRETHDYHHRNNAKMLGASIGSYPVVTTTMWATLTPSQRRWYAFARHPFTIATGYVFIFAIGMCLSPFRRNPKMHWQGPVTLLLHAAAFVLVAATLGPFHAFAAVVLPVVLATALGGYLFYAQHNFPDIVLRERQSWEFSYAALKSSSLFEMGPVGHWFTGNIGYHHVHHLNHRIPFYRLPEAMAAMPELQTPGRTSWRPRDVAACLRLKLWDPERGTMVGWSDNP